MKQGFIYAIEIAEWVKIGWSNDPIRRFAKLKTDVPLPARLIGAIAASIDEEKEVHHRLAAFRVSGEWFKHIDAVREFTSGLPPIERKRKRKQNNSALGKFRDQHNPPLNQFDLAQKLGVDRATVNRWENGTRKIEAERLPAICKLTGIPARQLRPDLALLFVEAAQ